MALLNNNLTPETTGGGLADIDIEDNLNVQDVDKLFAQCEIQKFLAENERVNGEPSKEPDTDSY